MGAECLQSYGGGSGVVYNSGNSGSIAQQTNFNTPNLNKLANEGMQFNHMYSQPICTSSRVKIMTGQYNFRNYTEFKDLNRNEPTIAHIAKAAGYKTGIAGKWQLNANTTEDFSASSGWDEYCLWYFDDYFERYKNPTLKSNDTRIATISPGKKTGTVNNALTGVLNATNTVRDYGPDINSDFIVDFINRNKDEKFLAYYTCVLPHYPFVPTPDQPAVYATGAGDGKNENDKYFPHMVNYMDKLIGKIMQALEDNGIADNTVIIFTSDNGTHRPLNTIFADGKIYKGGKGKLTNNGNWVPYIVKWPGVIAGGQQSDVMADFSDVLPTIAGIIGETAPTLKRDGTTPNKIDGQDLTPYFKGDNFTSRGWAVVNYEPKRNTEEKGKFIRDQKYKFYDGRKSKTQQADPNDITGWYRVLAKYHKTEHKVIDPENLPDQTKRNEMVAFMDQLLEEGNNNDQHPFFDTTNSGVPTRDGKAMTVAEILALEQSLATHKEKDLSHLITSSNPSKGVFSVKGLESDTAEIKVFDILGKTVFYKRCKVINGNVSINLSNKNDGIYIVLLKTKKGGLIAKIIKED